MQWLLNSWRSICNRKISPCIYSCISMIVMIGYGCSQFFSRTGDAQESHRIVTSQDFDQEELGTWRTGNLQQRFLHCERSLDCFCLETDTLLHTGKYWLIEKFSSSSEWTWVNLCTAILRWTMTMMNNGILLIYWPSLMLRECAFWDRLCDFGRRQADIHGS